MVTTEVTYICDTCGCKVSKPYPDPSTMRIIQSDVESKYPDGWQLMIEPFGLCCDRCMNAFMTVRESLMNRR